MPPPRDPWRIPPRLTDLQLWQLAEHERIHWDDCLQPGTGRNPKAAREHWRRYKTALAALEQRGIAPDHFSSQNEGSVHPSTEPPGDEVPGKERSSRKRLMYVELKTGFNDNGPAWIGYVLVSKSGRTLYARGKRLQRVRGGVAGNYYDLDNGDEYWVSGVKKNGQDRHWAGGGPVEIDGDARAEYERIRGGPVKADRRSPK